MFHTYPYAELPLPVGLAPNGERSWYWVELGIKAEYFFATAISESDEGVFSRHLWFSHIDEVIDMINYSGKHFQLTRLDIFSPGCMNGHGIYQLDQISQVWCDKNMPCNRRYLLVNGNILYDGLNSEQFDDKNMELLLAV
jgi:hypothetical protein